MDIYEMLENGMTVDEIKAEVDKTAAIYKEDQEAEQTEALAWAKEDLYDAIMNFLGACDNISHEILEKKEFQNSVRDAIDSFEEQLGLYSKITELIKGNKPPTAATTATTNDLKTLAQLFF